MSESRIHATAIVDPGAEIGAGVEIGPFSVVGDGVRIGEGCRIGAHVVIEGDTEVGPGNVISPMASIGGPPQDLKYDGERTRLTVGSGNTIREFVTLNRGTPGGGGVTVIGDDNLFMTQVHIAHDCVVGNGIIFANAATLAGHVEVGDRATVGAYSGVHQFCRVAREAFIGGYSVVTQDALPWVTTVGNRATTHGVNLVGMRRRGYAREVIRAVKTCYTTLFRSKLGIEDAIAKVRSEVGEYDEVRYFLEFVEGSKRGVVR